jgi:hypothetical protein
VIGSALASNAQELTGQQKIDQLIQSIQVIDNKIQLSVKLTTGAVGYAEVGGVAEDGSFDDALITEAMLVAYTNALDSVQNHDYAVAQTANQLFMQEHTASMYSLSLAVDDLVMATAAIASATSVADLASDADTKPEQVALQEMLATEEYSIQATEVAEYNDSLKAVETYATQAGAFLAAANNSELTASIDSYATQGNFLVGSYTAITYTQSVDEFVITWGDAGFNSGWQGYLSPDMKTTEDLYAASQYILTYGSPSPEM